MPVDGHERSLTYRNDPHWRDHTVVMVAGAAVAVQGLEDSDPWSTPIVGRLCTEEVVRRLVVGAR